MSFTSDLRVLWHLLFSPVRGKTHADRLDSFYQGQAGDYDAFRARLLRGREELIRQLQPPADCVWVDFGGGTGANLEWADWLPQCRKVYVVDLCAPLLEQCRKRVAERGWTNVEAIHADATRFQPPEPVDLVTFSYSLTMIPDWFAAIDQAWRILQPGGKIAVVDFFVSRKFVDPGRARHSWFTRSVMPVWFATDNVHLSRDHIAYLSQRFTVEQLTEHLAPIPYVPLLRAPYYRFVGRKGDAHQAAAGTPPASTATAGDSVVVDCIG
ncbi:MAG: methyltransferase domain-containing protein [Planctomycetaceae bacterium]|nr:MAG: methyltransferase domain-containing protein [Planctomycetaceae bacterium]